MALRRYVRTLVAATLALAAAVVAVNIAVDPYDVFALARGEPARVRLATSLRTAKAYAVRAQRPDCLVLGSSRAEVGIRPAHDGWDCRRPYNAGLPAGHIYEARRYLQHALAVGQVRRVHLGLDLEMFRTDARNRGEFLDARLAAGPAGEWTPYPIRELLGLALGIDALRKSLELLREPVAAPALEPTGERSAAWWERESGGRAVRALTAEVLPGVAQQIGQRDALRTDAGGHLPGLAELERIIELCHAAGVELRVAINPMHVLLHAAYVDVGRDGIFHQWKRDVRATVAAARSRGIDVPLWDFALINEVTTEPLPDVADRSVVMQGFWEPSHFRTALGDRMIDVMYRGRSAAADFVVPPTGAAGAERERADRAALARWQRAHPGLVRQVQDWLAPVRAGHGLESGLAARQPGPAPTD